MRFSLIKRENASELVMTALIWGVASLLTTRLVLSLTDYPKIGGGDWHIAHVLWGGLLMIAGMILILVYHGDRIKRTAAGIFGVGLGWFIDELGKYLTSDNNYFFEPAIVFIYIFFILLFLLYRYFEKLKPEDPKTMLYQAINQLEEIAERDLESGEKEKLTKKLKLVARRGDASTREFAQKLEELVRGLVPQQDKGEGWLWGSWLRIRAFVYHKIFKRKIVLIILIVLASGYILGDVFDLVVILSKFRINLFNFSRGGFENLSEGERLMFSLKTAADLLASGLFALGIFWVWKRKRLRGVNFFLSGLLVNIFLSSLFNFYFEQFSGVFGLAASIAVYNGLTKLKEEMVRLGKV